MGWLDLLKSDSRKACTAPFNCGDNCFTNSSSVSADVLMDSTNLNFYSS